MLDVHWVSLICICFISWLFGFIQGAMSFGEMLRVMGSPEFKKLFREEFKKINKFFDEEGL